MPEWVGIYLLGCIFALVLMAGDTIFFHALNWLLKGNVLKRNLKKLESPDTDTFWEKAVPWLAFVIFSVALSWIQVLFSLVTIPWKLIKILRESLAAVPQEIKQLRFPLYNNPHMSSEAVWAHLRALEAKNGADLQNQNTLLWSLSAAADNVPKFNRILALNHLRSLNVVSAEAIAHAIEELRLNSAEVE